MRAQLRTIANSVWNDCCEVRCMTNSHVTIRPPSQADRARALLYELIDRCTDALQTEAGSEVLLREAILDALHDFDACGLIDQSLRVWVIAQLRTIEFEADKMSVYGSSRLRHCLDHLRTVLSTQLL